MRLLLLAPILFLLGCTTIYFYPVQGPALNQTPVSRISARATGAFSGSISFELPNGEQYEGAWSPVSPDDADSDLIDAWDSIYGTGFYKAHVLGSKWHTRAAITGSKGARFTLEAFRDTVAGSPLQGVAKDNHGIIYKVTDS